MKTPTEAEIQKTCLEWLALVRAVAVRVNSGGVTVAGRFIRFNHRKGCSDALVCLPPDGRYLACEFKRPGEVPTDHQSEFLDDVRRAGGLGLVVTSLDDLRAQLAGAGVVL